MVNDQSGTIMSVPPRYQDIQSFDSSGEISRGVALFVNSITTTQPVPKITTLTCATPSTNTITYQKYVSGGTGIIDIEFNNINDFNTYYNSYLTVVTGTTTYATTSICFPSGGVWSGTPFNNTDIRYYRQFYLSIPSNTGSTNCGDGTTVKTFNLHYSSVLTTGTTGSNYTMRLTMPTMLNGLTYDPLCNVSGVVQNLITIVNTSSTGTSNNFTGTTTTGSKYTDPFNRLDILCSGVTSVSASTISGDFDYPK
jgi:hypothetical protein